VETKKHTSFPLVFLLVKRIDSAGRNNYSWERIFRNEN
jgi:hypothetical protein